MPHVFDHGSEGVGVMECWSDEAVIHSTPILQCPFRNWSARQDLHLRSLGPKPSVLLLHYALMTPDADFESAGVEKRDAENLGTRLRGKI